MSMPSLQLTPSELLEAPVSCWHPFLQLTPSKLLEAQAPLQCPFLCPVTSGTLEARTLTGLAYLRHPSTGSLEADEVSHARTRPLTLASLPAQSVLSFLHLATPLEPFNQGLPMSHSVEMNARMGSKNSLKESIGNNKHVMKWL